MSSTHERYTEGHLDFEVCDRQLDVNKNQVTGYSAGYSQSKKKFSLFSGNKSVSWGICSDLYCLAGNAKMHAFLHKVLFYWLLQRR